MSFVSLMGITSMTSKFIPPAALAFCLLTAVIPLPVKAMPSPPTIEVAQATTPLTEASVQAVVDQLQAARANKDQEGKPGLRPVRPCCALGESMVR
jgi:hypothetical protein